MASIFEIVMLICFGFSWPINAYKAYNARTAKATSLAFMLLIIGGYIAGIVAKFISGNLSYVLYVYFVDLALVVANLLIYIRNRRLDKLEEAKA